MWLAHVGIRIAMVEDSWFVTDSIVWSHHVYKDRCTPTMDETLQRLREEGNRVHRFAVGVYI